MEEAAPVQTWTEDYKINSFLVNLQKRAGLYAILNLVQDVGTQHAIRQKLNIPGKNLVVFTRQKLVMERWPDFNETLSIKTWLRPITQFVVRDCELWVKDEKVGICASTFAVIDAETRRRARFDLSSYSDYSRSDYNLPLETPKIPLRGDLKDLAEFQVRNSDIDLNSHVNNTKYAQWILDSVPIDHLRTGRLHEYEINFLLETKIGDKITVQGQSNFVNATRALHFQGLRQADQKTVFSARMTVSDNAQ